MSNLHDLSSNEIYKLLEEIFVSQNFNKSFLRNVWIMSDVYNEEVQKYKVNEISICFMIKIEKRELQSFTIKNAITTDDFKSHAIKFLKTIPNP